MRVCAHPLTSVAWGKQARTLRGSRASVQAPLPVSPGLCKGRHMRCHRRSHTRRRSTAAQGPQRRDFRAHGPRGAQHVLPGFDPGERRRREADGPHGERPAGPAHQGTVCRACAGVLLRQVLWCHPSSLFLPRGGGEDAKRRQPDAGFDRAALHTSLDQNSLCSTPLPPCHAGLVRRAPAVPTRGFMCCPCSPSRWTRSGCRVEV